MTKELQIIKYKNMKRYFILPKISTLSFALLLSATVIVVSDGCAPKPGCGNKRDHRIRKKRVKKFAPSMSYIFVKPTLQKNSFWA
ncbi:hypothetical protein BH10BAC1_BH10BAC1_05160 [soil metagenome]